jgi:hypothetical protein
VFLGPGAGRGLLNSRMRVLMRKAR